MTQQSGTVTYSCPNCSAGLIFNPEKQKFCCEFCRSEFTDAELQETYSARQAAEAASAAAEAAAAAERPDDNYCAAMRNYACVNCGAEIVADDNTAATECPYCHNPVILVGRLAGQMRPQKVIPFEISKEEAERRFLRFAGSKRFVPRDFKSEKHASEICGIYYPFWVTDADTSASMSARATRVRYWMDSDYNYTETSNFHIEREGDIHFEDIVTPALKEEDGKMLSGILPYPSEAQKPFDMSYLSGFIAKKRDIEKESVREAVRARMSDYSKRLLRDTITAHYTTVIPDNPRLLVKEMHWDYVLMPIWLLSYQHRGKTYTYAINGNTGKVYGELPVSGKRVSVFGGIMAAVIGALAALLAALLL